MLAAKRDRSQPYRSSRHSATDNSGGTLDVVSRASDQFAEDDRFSRVSARRTNDCIAKLVPNPVRGVFGCQESRVTHTKAARNEDYLYPTLDETEPTLAQIAAARTNRGLSEWVSFVGGGRRPAGAVRALPRRVG